MGTYTIPVERVRRRADFFLVEAELLCATPLLRTCGFQLRPEFAEATAEAYFLLNEAYKSQRMMGDATRTQDPKIAAMTCIAIGVLNPLRPAQVPDPQPPILQYANPMLAMRCASHIVNHPFEGRPFEECARFYDSVRRLQLPSLNQYIRDVRVGARNVGDPFKIDLSFDEIREIENKVSLFTVLQELPIFTR